MAGDLTNIILDPIFIFAFHMGVRGAAIAHVISQYLISAILFWRLMEKVDLLPPSLKYMQFSRFLTNGEVFSNVVNLYFKRRIEFLDGHSTNSYFSQ